MGTNTRVLFPVIATVILFVMVACDVSHIAQYQNGQHYSQIPTSDQNSVLASSRANTEFDTEQDHHYHGQDGRYNPNDDGTGWDIRLSVPGEPERDYPVLNTVPKTAFNCVGKKSGYYADTQARCQVFRVCAVNAPNGFFSFLCPNGTLFNQAVLVCDWWMNVQCKDSEKYLNKNSATTISAGPEMMANIEKMIKYPMSNPYPPITTPMRQTEQSYNPPIDMFSMMQILMPQNEPENDNDGRKTSGSFRLPTPNNDLLQQNLQKDSFSSDAAFLGQNPITKKYEGIVPKIQSSIYSSNIGNAAFGLSSFGGLHFQHPFDSNTQAIKITKQQFTYPSPFDREYLLTVPKTPTAHPHILHVPINIPAIDTNGNSVSVNNIHGGSNKPQSFTEFNSSHKNETASTILHDTAKESFHINTSKAIPLIVLFLQPPLDTTLKNANNQLNEENTSEFVVRKESASQIKNIKDAVPTISTNNTHLKYYNYFQTPRGFTKSNNLGSNPHFATNLTTQANYYIKNNLSGSIKSQPKINPDAENINNPFKNHKPLYPVFNSNLQENNSILTSQISDGFKNTSFIELTKNQQFNNITTNQREENVKNFVTLLSAQIIPGGDINKQRVFKICVPRDFLSYLMHLHNSTKSALETAFRNNKKAFERLTNTNTTVNIHSQPIIQTIMESLFMKNNSSDQQVPILTGEEIYRNQKISGNRFGSVQSDFNGIFGRQQSTNYQNQKNAFISNVSQQQKFVQSSMMPGVSQYNGQSLFQNSFGDVNDQNQQIKLDGLTNRNQETLGKTEEKQSNQNKYNVAYNNSLNVNQFHSQIRKNFSAQINGKGNLNGVLNNDKIYSTFATVEGNEKIQKATYSNNNQNGPLQNTFVENSGNYRYNYQSNPTIATPMPINYQTNERVDYGKNVQRNETTNIAAQGFNTVSQKIQSNIQTNSQYQMKNTNFGFAKFDKNSQKGNVLLVEKQGEPPEENYNDGQLISVQQRFPFRGPSQLQMQNSPNEPSVGVNVDSQKYNQNNYKVTNTHREYDNNLYFQSVNSNANIGTKTSTSEEAIKQNKSTAAQQISNYPQPENYETGSLIGIQSYIPGKTSEPKNIEYYQSNKHISTTNSAVNVAYTQSKISHLNSIGQSYNIQNGQNSQSNPSNGYNYNNVPQQYMNVQTQNVKTPIQNTENNKFVQQISDDMSYNRQHQMNSQHTQGYDSQFRLMHGISQTNNNQNVDYNQNVQKNMEDYNQNNNPNVNFNPYVQKKEYNNNIQVDRNINNNIYSLTQGSNEQYENQQKSNYASNVNAGKLENKSLYTTIEVVPALGFALNSEEERQQYYDALSKGLKNYENQRTPYVQKVATYSPALNTNQHQMQNHEENNYQAQHYNLQANIMRDAAYARHLSQSQFGSQNRIVHGHVITHQTAPIVHNTEQESQPLEELGYPQVKPSISFVY